MLLPCWSRFATRIVAKPIYLGRHQFSRGYFEDSKLSNSNRRDIWKTRREKFMRNILRLVKHGKAEEANELFSSMIKKHKVRPTTALFNAVIKGHAEVGNIKSSFRLFNELKKRGLVPSNHTYSTMFNACSQAGPDALVILDKLLSEIERRDVSLNTQSFNAQLAALVHCGQSDKAFELFSSSHVPQSSIETFGTLLLAAARDRMEGMAKFVVVWNELIKHFEPNDYCYNTLLLCIRDGGVPNHMLQSSRNVTVLPNVDDYAYKSRKKVIITADKEVLFTLLTKDRTTPLKMCIHISKKGVRWIGEESLTNFLQSMDLNKTKPGIRTFSILSSIFPDFAKILSLSEKFGIKLDHQMSRSASQLRKICGDVMNAQAIAKAIPTDGPSESSLVAGARLCKDYNDVLSTVDKLKRSGSMNDTEVWRILIDVCVRQRSYKTLLYILKEMRHNEVVITPDIFDVLDETISKPPKNQWLLKSFNGFKGYYKLWCNLFGKEL